MWFCILANEDLKYMLITSFVQKLPSIKPFLLSVLFESDVSAHLCSNFKRDLYRQHLIGDNPDQPPHLDGKNGLHELRKILDVCGVPYTYTIGQTKLTAQRCTYAQMDSCMRNRESRLVVESESADALILFVRCHRDKFRPPMYLGGFGCFWKVAACLIGNEFMGHQIGVARIGDNEWSMADADDRLRGIGPCTWITSEDSWFEDMQVALPAGERNGTVSHYGPYNNTNEFNKHTMRCAAQKSCSNADVENGTTNSDWMYTRLPGHPPPQAKDVRRVDVHRGKSR